ncbi:MAG: STAS domain-containing protein [Clostridia bacterium]|nr:STAS domain-containing protein [Clostridia bacterium]
MKETNKLTINKISDGNRLTLALVGHLSTATAIELDTLLGESLDGVTELVFDFSELKYISSAGLRVLLSTQKRMNSRGSMKITGASSNIIEIFDITGFTDFFTIESRS